MRAPKTLESCSIVYYKLNNISYLKNSTGSVQEQEGDEGQIDNKPKVQGDELYGVVRVEYTKISRIVKPDKSE